MMILHAISSYSTLSKLDLQFRKDALELHLGFYNLHLRAIHEGYHPIFVCLFVTDVTF